jgi:hypothetical protein
VALTKAIAGEAKVGGLKPTPLNRCIEASHLVPHISDIQCLEQQEK